MNTPIKYEGAIFTLESGGEDGIEVLGIHDPKTRWNGFARPLMLKAEVERLGETIATNAHGISDDHTRLSFDEHGVLSFTDFHNEVTENIEPTIIDGKTYFDVGLGWCWYVDPLLTRLDEDASIPQIEEYLRCLCDVGYSYDFEILDLEKAGVNWSDNMPTHNMQIILHNHEIIFRHDDAYGYAQQYVNSK